jgi:GWxTD domain-containing protein
MKRLAVFAIAAALVLPALPAFGRLAKYQDWPNTPPGYFMTHAERVQWSKLESDTDAEKFIADFFARRPENFQKEVADRAANADKYLSISTTPGSKTLRGRVVILFGVPTAMDVTDQPVITAGKRDNAIVAGIYSNANTQGSSSGEPYGTVNGGLPSGKTVRIFHFNYQGPIARTVDRKQIDVAVEADPVSGKDRIASRSEQDDLESMFEIVAQSWIKK